MQQLEALCIPFVGLQDEAIEGQARRIAEHLRLPLNEISPGADVWFAVLVHPQGAIQLHYDWPGECFWLTPAGELANKEEGWQELKRLVVDFR